MPPKLEKFDPAEQVDRMIALDTTKPKEWSDEMWRQYQLRAIAFELSEPCYISPQKAQKVGVDMDAETNENWMEAAKQRIDAIRTYVEGEREKTLS
jgi:hypothetical protein